MKDKYSPTPDDDLLIAVYTKVYKNATGTFSLNIDVLDGQTQASDLPGIASVSVTINTTLSEPGQGPNVISSLFVFSNTYSILFFNYNILGIFELFYYRGFKFVYELE